MRSPRVLAVGVVAAVVLTTAPATASHFRASTSSASYANGHITWDVVQAWRKGSSGRLVGSGSRVQFTDEAGASASATAADPVTTENQDNPLYDVVEENVDLDVSGLLSTPGKYKAYVSECCRIDGIQNSSSGYGSQALGFSVAGDGTVDLPPQFDQASLYKLIPPGGGGDGLELDFRATDPTGSTVTYELVTNTESPDYGASEMACSSLDGGIFTLAASLCDYDETFSEIYTPGSVWAVKVRASDSAGNHSETDTLLRSPSAPAPNVAGEVTLDKSTATFELGLDDVDTYVDEWATTCTSTTDPTDAHSAVSTTSQVVVTGLKPGTTYTCTYTATNAVGTGDGSVDVTTGNFQSQSITFAAIADVTLPGQDITLTATASSELPVTYASETPEVCTVSDGIVSLVGPGTCTITASQAGDETFEAAAPVQQSFDVAEAVPAGASVVAPHQVVGTRALPVTCRLSGGTVARTVGGCQVTAYAWPRGDRVEVGSGGSTQTGDATDELDVTVTLNAQGRALANRPGGMAVHLAAVVQPVDGDEKVATTTTRMVFPKVVVRPVYFSPGSATLRPPGLAHLRRVRAAMGDVSAVSCTGYTDNRGDRAHPNLGVRRAAAACAVVARDVADEAVTIQASERTTHSNATASGRALNRRARVVLSY